MDEKKPGGLINNWPSVALITALAANLLWLQAPLKSSRPAERAAFEETALGDQDAEARLWQDPFEAVTLDQQRKLSNKGSQRGPTISRYTTKEVRQQIASRSDRNITIMPVMVTGSPYNEGAEWRIRGRFAVLAGLSRSGYRPYDPEHVGYFEMGWPRGETLKGHSAEEARNECSNDKRGENCLRLTVPFEWFEPQDRVDAVLLLWIKDDMFEDFPFKRLKLLTRALTDNIGIEKKIKFKIIGPWSSTTLKAMLTDDTKLDGGEIYSPSATAPDSLLLKNPHQPLCETREDRRADVKEKLKEKIKFHNLTLTDDLLICALITELKLRGVNPDKDAIALVSEWDTFYGRALPDTFSKLLHRDDLIRVSYLRGLDGKLASRDSPSSQTTGDLSKEEGINKRREIAPLERPEGNSQLDYIPRLAVKLKDGDPDRHIKAIGVLGSDVYDKLLLLQSLRTHFPNVIFFTTDLDARLFHSKELNWSRNLIVASSFGLQLKKDIQGDIPPFRDSYQTATFLASQLALPRHGEQLEIEQLEKVATDLDTSITPLLPVQLFEIGRVGAYPLSADPTTQSVHSPNPHSSKDLWGSHLGKVLLMIVGFLFFVLLLIGYFSATARNLGKIVRQTFRRDIKELPPPFQYFKKLGIFRGLIWFLMLLPLILATAIFVAHFSGRDEPFSLIDGISIWPAEVTRMAAAYLSLYFLFLTWSELKKNDHDLLDKYFPETKEKIEQLRKKRRENEILQFEMSSRGGVWRKLKVKWRNWRAFVRSISINGWDPNIFPDDGEGEAYALQLWENYTWRGSFWHRVFRFLPILSVYICSAVMLGLLLGCVFPFVPYRGDISYWSDKLVLSFTALTLIFLIFFVVDAAQLCRKFIDNLSHPTTQWPSDTYDQFEKDCRIHRDYLDEWIGLRLIGEQTKVVGKLIFYPFIVLLLAIVSRYEFFDRWEWPILLMLVFGLNSGYAIYAVLVIRRSAENARREAIVKLKHKLLRVLGGERKYPMGENREEHELRPSRSLPTQAWTTLRASSLASISTKPKPRQNDPDKDQKNSDLPEQIRLLIHEVESYEEGAFVPLSKHPVIGALAIPFGGAGVLAVLDYLTSM